MQVNSASSLVGLSQVSSGQLGTAPGSIPARGEENFCVRTRFL